MSACKWDIVTNFIGSSTVSGANIPYLKPRETRTSESKKEKGGNRERGRGRGSVTSAITSSEMHLDRVSICQNKAASTAASLMAMDVSDRGGGKMGVGTCTFKETHNTAKRAQITHAHTNTTAANPFFACSRYNQSFDTKFLQSYTVIAIKLVSCLGMCVHVCSYALEYVSVCVRAQCVHVYLLTVFLVVRYLLPSLIVMNWALCQSLI